MLNQSSVSTPSTEDCFTFNIFSTLKTVASHDTTVIQFETLSLFFAFSPETIGSYFCDNTMPKEASIPLHLNHEINASNESFSAEIYIGMNFTRAHERLKCTEND